MSSHATAWKVGTYVEDDRALNEDQVTRLAAKHGLDLDTLDNLSCVLAAALHPRRNLRRDASKPPQGDRADQEAEKLVRDIATAERKIAAARNRATKLDSEVGLTCTDTRTPAVAQVQEFDQALSAIASLRHNWAAAARDGRVSLKPIADKRRNRDQRRRMICSFIFRIWEEAGRNISYTTDPITSERCGPLVDFVRDVVECISDPPGRLSGEVIKSEIENFKARRASRAAAGR
jgi:hypothetical protein